MTAQVNESASESLEPALAARMFAAQSRAEARLGRRLTLQEIGAEVGRRIGRQPAAPSVVRRWLRGQSEPSLDTLHALAAVFGVSPGWLAFGEGDPTPRPGVPVADRLPVDEAELLALAEKDDRRAAGSG